MGLPCPLTDLICFCSNSTFLDQLVPVWSSACKPADVTGKQNYSSMDTIDNPVSGRSIRIRPVFRPIIDPTWLCSCYRYRYHQPHRVFNQARSIYKRRSWVYREELLHYYNDNAGQLYAEYGDRSEHVYPSQPRHLSVYCIAFHPNFEHTIESVS